jgi:hypothetical protein
MSRFWIDLLINSAPILLLIVVWIFFMARLRRGGFNTKYQVEYLEQMRQQNATLERIAAALEKRD